MLFIFDEVITTIKNADIKLSAYDALVE